jgi:hypothetical protein
MKKQIKKLNLNKRTISNLNTVEMNQKAGGLRRTEGCEVTDWCTHRCNTLYCGPTQQGHTCNGNC